MGFFNKYANVVAMFATPFITIFIWLFYRKGRYNYTEHLVANLYFSGFAVLVYGLVIGPLGKILNIHGKANPLLMLYFLFEITYRSISYYYFMNQRTTGSAVKAIAVSFTALLIWVMLSFLVIYFYIKTGLWGLAD